MSECLHFICSAFIIVKESDIVVGLLAPALVTFTCAIRSNKLIKQNGIEIRLQTSSWVRLEMKI